MTTYKFEGKTIKLTPKDYDEWVKRFPLVDLDTELYVADLWHTQNKTKDWFIRVANWLAKAEQREKETNDFTYNF
jgi:hypothetical protein